MAKFKVEVCRISYSFATIEVEAENEIVARDVAWNEAGNYEYNEKDVEYEPQGVTEIK